MTTIRYSVDEGGWGWGRRGRKKGTTQGADCAWKEKHVGKGKATRGRAKIRERCTIVSTTNIRRLIGYRHAPKDRGVPNAQRTLSTTASNLKT